MKRILSTEEIQFIDTYLENSDIVYADIRMEMIDHIASDLEERLTESKTLTFYEVFKDYMVENKARFLKGNKQFIKSADRFILSKFKQKIKSGTFVLLLIAFFGIIYFSLDKLSLDSIKNIIGYSPFFPLIPLFIIYFLLVDKFNLRRFSGIERLGFVYIAFFQFFNLCGILVHKNLKSSPDLLYVSILLSAEILLGFLLIKVSLEVLSHYKKVYKLTS
ncbi:MAG: hypothetical protein AAF688_06610 [Bacteroidota bacterium]